eukprot:9084044-Pyramimonas_sp.AAC.1
MRTFKAARLGFMLHILCYDRQRVWTMELRSVDKPSGNQSIGGLLSCYGLTLASVCTVAQTRTWCRRAAEGCTISVLDAGTCNASSPYA